MRDTRATGWKVPLFFCAGMLCIVGITALLRHQNIDVPEVVEPLMQEARAIHMNLDADEESRAWKEDISAVAGAFATRADKDMRIAALVRRATQAKRYDAACTAAVLMYNDHARDAALREVGQGALEECATLPWTVMAAKGVRDAATQAELHLLVNARWKECGK